MKMTTKPFKGSNVFLSRNLVPPEIFAAVHDALKQNGAEVFLCCDPSRTGPNDFHVISSPQHEKFEDLKTKGCKLLGPQCVLSCAKENRSLPKQSGFTCCLAMDGVKVLASGFDKDEKVKIEALVIEMGGVILNRALMDVSFVVVKNVLAAKYKWALTVLKKPIVTSNWLYQCWNEHRLVPQEAFRVPPFSGLTICLTRVKADVRKEMEKLIRQNGGEYSADLTRNCTHLVSDAPEGDKYKVARKWGHIQVVTPKWLDQSIARRACLDEESYPVQVASTSSACTTKSGRIGGRIGQHSQVKGNTHSQSAQSSHIAESDATYSENLSYTFSDSTIFTKDADSEAPNLQPGDETNYDGFVADDSQTEDDDSYLSDCRILFVGFQASELRKLLKLVQKGGGSRCTSFSEQKLTHIVVGAPSENEKKEIRQLAALGIIYVVKTVWLEDCDREKKEVPVSQRHFPDLLPPKAVTGNFGMNQGKSSMDASVIQNVQVKKDMDFEVKLPLENCREKKLMKNLEGGTKSEEAAKSGQQDDFCPLNDGFEDQKKLHPSGTTGVQDRILSNIFKGLLFRFSRSFPKDHRAEVVEWIKQGGGALVDDHSKQSVQFIVESHGSVHESADVSHTLVSSHWIRCCLEVGCMPDVGSHIIYSPLRCRVPFPGFEGFRFCVSQYEKEERLLLKNLCVVLGAKCVEKLTKKATHLLCKFSSGPKYEHACKWGIQSVTSEWISECIRQDSIVPMDLFRPKDATAQDRDAGLCTTSQYPTQAARMTSLEVSSQFPSQSEVTESYIANGSNSSKAVMLTQGDDQTDILLANFYKDGKMDPSRNNTADAVREVSLTVSKQESGGKQGKQLITSELVSESIRQQDSFGPEDVRAQDQEAGLCTMSYYHTEATWMASGDVSSQFPSHSQVSRKIASVGSNSISSKRVRLSEDNSHIESPPAKYPKEVSNSIGKTDSPKNSIADDSVEVSHSVPDVAAAIEDLLAESNKIQDLGIPGRNGSDQNIFSPDCSILGQDHVDSRSVFGISKHWLSRVEKQDDPCNPSGREVSKGLYDGFSETQTDSQVVVYEEDLSGRQRIIERVQTRSSLT